MELFSYFFIYLARHFLCSGNRAMPTYECNCCSPYGLLGKPNLNAVSVSVAMNSFRIDLCPYDRHVFNELSSNNKSKYEI